jgi:hypothetical protein
MENTRKTNGLNGKQRMMCEIFYNMYFIIVCSFLSYIEKESKVSTKGRKNTQVQLQAFPIFIANWLAFNFDGLVSSVFQNCVI